MKILMKSIIKERKTNQMKPNLRSLARELHHKTNKIISTDWPHKLTTYIKKKKNNNCLLRVLTYCLVRTWTSPQPPKFAMLFSSEFRKQIFSIPFKILLIFCSDSQFLLYKDSDFSRVVARGTSFKIGFSFHVPTNHFLKFTEIDLKIFVPLSV